MRKLREKISDLKVQVTSITKGIPISQWDMLAGRERRKSDPEISSTTSPDSSEETGTTTSSRV